MMTKPERWVSVSRDSYQTRHLLVCRCWAIFLVTVLSQAVVAQIEEVVVTAQKRPQPEEVIGAAIFALDTSELETQQIRQPRDLNDYIPNVDIKNTLGNTNPVVTIRGVGLNDFVANNDQSAGIYSDEVFMASPAMMSFQVFDVARAEVLLGPQGTLYGRNTTAGAINFISNKPTQDFLTDLHVGYGNFGRFHGEAVVNGGITENLAGRLSMTGDWSNDGHFNNRFTGNDYGELSRWALRGQVTWRPDEETELLLKLHGGHDGSDAMTNWIALGILDLATGGTCEAAREGDRRRTVAECTDILGFQDRDNDPFTGAWDLEPEDDTWQYGVSLTATRHFDNATLTSITAYEALDRFLEEEADGSPVVGLHIDYNNFIEQFSQELRLVSDKPLVLEFLPGEIDWIIGGFYHFDERIGDPSQRFNLRDWFNDVLFVEWDQDTQSAAAFAHIEWKLTDRWQLILGGRYTWEEKEFFSNSGNLIPFDGPSGLTGSTTPFRNSRDNRISNNEFTGTAGIEFIPGDNILAYMKFSKGFKSGGFSGLLAGSQEELDPYNEEELFAYEGGVKATLLDRTLRINASAFYYDYEGMQVFAIPLDALVQVPRLTNAQQADVVGLDTNIRWQPVTGLEFSTSIGWLNHENNDPRFDGLDLPNAPEISLSHVVRYQRNLGNGFRLTSMLHVNYESDSFKTVENNPLLKTDSHSLVNARLTLQKDEDWELALWGQNLTNTEHIEEAFDQSDLGYVIYSYGMPRTYGVSVTYRWE